ncbi:MAG: tetratricopeptide repeat protein [Gammaproteobacteria bacterium]|nr:tetratricopeptide repeat protein [Gammaproteobacteria bacterium]
MTAVLRHIGIFSALIFLASCAAPINRYNADRYYEIGLENEFSGNYARAREAFNRALINADLAGAPPSYISAVLYNLGRMHGYTCDFESAEQLLMEALATERALETPDPVNIAKRLSELARLSFDLEKFEQSANYYSEAVPVVEQLGILRDDPVGYAYFLEGYSDALRRLGRTDAASAESNRAKLLKSENEGVSANFVPIEYRDVCVGETAL